MARIGKGGLLSRRQEVGLGRKAQSGDSEDRRRFVERNLQLAVSRESGGQGLPLEVLIQEGNMGLMKAKFF
jgi:RNA polymerase primary sigma factor